MMRSLFGKSGLKHKRYLLIILLLLCGEFSFSQTKVIIDSLEVNLYRISSTNQDSIDFIYVKAKPETRDILLFMQGSLPVPLIIEDKGFSFAYSFLKSIVQKHQMNLLVVSQPDVHNIEQKSILKDGYLKTDSNYFPSDKHRAGNNLTNQANRYATVIRFMSEIMPEPTFYVFGHSQGSRIAPVVAKEFGSIKKLVLAATNPISRSYKRITEARIQYILGKKSFEEAQAIINKEYKYFERLHQNKLESPEDVSEHSYGFPTMVEDMVVLDIPIRFIYGTHDFGTSFDADKLLLEFIRNNKSNLSLKVYEGMDHNFFSKGVMHWDLAIDDTMKWFKGD